MGNLDTMIGAHALALDVVLVTNDSSFARIKKLKVEDWTKGPRNDQDHAFLNLAFCLRPGAAELGLSFCSPRLLRAAASRRLGFGWSSLCNRVAQTWGSVPCSTQNQCRRTRPHGLEPRSGKDRIQIEHGGRRERAPLERRN